MRQRKILKLLIFGMVFMLFSCVNDEVISKMEHVHSNKTEIVTINKVPIIITSIQKFNQNYRLISKEDLTNNTSSIENLNLDLNHILVYTKLNNGYTSYSIPIINPIPYGQPYYFENLHVIGNNEKSFIYRWTPQDKNIPFPLKTYTGKLEKFDIDYNLKISDNYINGISQPKTNRLSNKSGGDNEMGEVEIDCSTASACSCQGKGDNYCGCDPKDDMYKSYCVSSLYIYCYLSGGGGTGGEGGTGEGGTGEGGTGEGGGGGGGSTGDTGDGDSGTGVTGTGPVDPIDQPIDEVVPIIVDEDIDECEILKKLQVDNAFKVKMIDLKNAALNYSFEKLYQLYDDTTPNIPAGQIDIFDYTPSQGTVDEPYASYSGFTNIKGLIHSHFIGLTSVFSAQDLQDFYLKMKNPQVSDEFFIGLVTHKGSAYILQVQNRATFIAFGDKYLASDNSIYNFMTNVMYGKYDIRPDYNAETNELSFLKMMSDFNMGLSIASSNFTNTTPNIDLFKKWTKIVYNKTLNEKISTNCK